MTQACGATALWRSLVALVLGVFFTAAPAQEQAEAAEQLRAQRSALSEQLQHNAFNRPLVLMSAETPDGLRGDTYALMDFPFALVSILRCT